MAQRAISHVAAPRAGAGDAHSSASVPGGAVLPERLSVSVGDSSLGRVLVAWSDRGVRAVLLGDDADALRRDLTRRFPRAETHEEPVVPGGLAARVVAFVESPSERADLPLDVRGTEFQRSVWRALCEVPAGETTSYKQLAIRVGRPGSVRAVGQAVGANPLAVLVPCHRAIRDDGALSGYRWGVERKRRLLAKESPTPEQG